MNEPPAGEAIATVDRRVRRTRAALLSAAIDLTSRRQTTDIPVTDVAEVADVSRRVLYQHFGSLEGLIVASVEDLLQAELLPRIADDLDVSSTTLEIAKHVAQHSSFYRAVLMGACAHATTAAVSALFRPYRIGAARQTFGDLDDDTADEVGDYLTGGTVAAMTRWLVNTPEPHPEEFAERMQRIQQVLAGADRNRATHPAEGDS